MGKKNKQHKKRHILNSHRDTFGSQVKKNEFYFTVFVNFRSPPRIHLRDFRTGTFCVLFRPYITIKIFKMQKMSYFIPPYLSTLFIGEFTFHSFCICIRFFKSKNKKKSKLKSVFTQTLKKFSGRVNWFEFEGGDLKLTSTVKEKKATDLQGKQIPTMYIISKKF